MYLQLHTASMTQKTNIQPCACTTVRKANRALYRFYEIAMAGTGLSITQFSILRSLKRTGPSPLSTLAETLVMERTSLYRTIAPLVEAGAITLKEGDNKKIKIADLTPNGIAMIEAARPNWEKAQNAIMAAIGETEWAALSKTLLTIPNLVSDLK